MLRKNKHLSQVAVLLFLVVFSIAMYSCIALGFLALIGK